MKYTYVGWGPEVDPEGELVRPGDEREFGEQPTWGRWAAIDPPPETGGGDPPAPPAVPPVTSFTTPPATQQEM